MNEQTLRVYKDLMGDNHTWADVTRRLLSARGVHMLNLIGSPGAGKTRLLEAAAPRLFPRLRFAVLEGDVETTRDAERMARLGVPTSQLLSGGSCHLEAKLVHYGLRDLEIDALDLVFVENVGNLVCPAEFDIGEHAKVAVLSVTEGEDKPHKYPLLFREAEAVVLTKTDLLPHLDYDLEAVLRAVEDVHAGIPVFQTSARAGDGIQAFTDWLAGRVAWRETT